MRGLSRILLVNCTRVWRESFSEIQVLTCSKSEISFQHALKMSSHFAERSSIKNCSVVLKPLDEKLLKEYLEKFKIKSEPQNGEADKSRDSRTKSSEGTIKRTRNSPVVSKRQRKRRIKPSCSSNEGNYLNDENIFKLPNTDQCDLSRLKTSEKDGKMNPRKIWLERLRENLASCENNNEVDCEIEIIKVFPKPETMSTLTCRDSGQLEKLEEFEFERREDGEDDRITVIFEEELHKEVELDEVFQEKIVFGKQLKNREITNRKKQRLVKFKRKSMTGWNSVKFRKSKSKFLENGQDPSEKLRQCVNEEDLKEVCLSVKSLHDSCGIIQRLQKELPKFANTELAIHFAKVIHAQQENFHKELKRSQRIIMKCYDKMLNVYCDTKGVASEISTRTSLSVEDVVHIISRCILIEGHCDVDKSRSNPTEKTVSSQQRTVCEGSQKLPNLSQMSTSEKFALGESLVTQPQECVIQPVECTQRPNYSFHESPAVQWGMGHTGRWEGEIQKKQRLQNCDPNTISGQLPQSFQTNPRSSDSVLGRLLRPYSSGTNPVQQCSVNIPSQSSQCQPGNFVPVSPDLTTVYPPPLYWYNGPTITNQPLQTSQNSGTSVTSMDTQIQTAQKEMCLVDILTTNSDGLYSQTRTCPTPVELPERNKGSEVTVMRNSEETGVLDPTIPQKLTMRNCRLQAGPVLDVQNDSPKESGMSSQRTNTETDSSKQKNSRVYVCAQNDCKNPGVKICSFCRSVIYCSGTCQLKHWTQKHKVECYQLKKLRG